MNDKILIASPVRSRGWILPYFIDHILNIEYPKKNLGCFFVINNSTDNSEELIRGMYEGYKKVYRSFDLIGQYYPNVAEDTRIGSRAHVYPVLTDLRNTIRNYFLNTDYDYLFSIDSDILVKPNILNELLKLDTIAASAVICNDKRRINGSFGNVMFMEHNDPIHFKHITFADVGDVFEADLSGACTLYKKEVYGNNRKYISHVTGEDWLFCIQLHEAGIKFKCKKGLATHIMNQERLEEFLNDKR